MIALNIQGDKTCFYLSVNILDVQETVIFNIGLSIVSNIFYDIFNKFIVFF